MTLRCSPKADAIKKANPKIKKTPTWPPTPVPSPVPTHLPTPLPTVAPSFAPTATLSPTLSPTLSLRPTPVPTLSLAPTPAIPGLANLRLVAPAGLAGGAAAFTGEAVDVAWAAHDTIPGLPLYLYYCAAPHEEGDDALTTPTAACSANGDCAKMLSSAR